MEYINENKLTKQTNKTNQPKQTNEKEELEEIERLQNIGLQSDDCKLQLRKVIRDLSSQFEIYKLHNTNIREKLDIAEDKIILYIESIDNYNKKNDVLITKLILNYLINIIILIVFIIMMLLKMDV